MGFAPQGLEKEGDIWTIHDVPEPMGVALEVGGILALGGGDVLVCTRRGKIWRIQDAYDDAVEPTFTLWVDGLQEPLGLAVHPDDTEEWEQALSSGTPYSGPIWCTQRGELTRMQDTTGDGRGNIFETICDDWAISGNYHEYAFGPAFTPDGSAWVTLNKPFGGQPFGVKDWRGWAVRVDRNGEMHAEAAGLRSPAGVETSPWGEVFYTDNQGEWCGASKLSHIERGDFHGHPHGIESAKHPESLVKHPGEVPDGMPMPEVREIIEHFKLPAVWFPYDKAGKSPAGFVWDTEGNLGPFFKDQVFVGDQHHAAIFRVFLEKVNGHWQGAVFPFRYGFESGIVRLAWGEKGELLVGMTNRGWASRGTKPWGLQRLKWTGVTPFEVEKMEATPDGFRITFTRDVDPATAVEPTNYRMSSYTYRLHSPYGSPEINTKQVPIEIVQLDGDNRTVTLRASGLREGYVHELHLTGVRDAAGEPLLHDVAFYTLIERPE
jgi:glucose/arabinose dehydrogenase